MFEKHRIKKYSWNFSTKKSFFHYISSKFLSTDCKLLYPFFFQSLTILLNIFIYEYCLWLDAKFYRKTAKNGLKIIRYSGWENNQNSMKSTGKEDKSKIYKRLKKLFSLLKFILKKYAKKSRKKHKFFCCKNNFWRYCQIRQNM